MTTAFQPNGFQNNAFQIDSGATVTKTFAVDAVLRKPGQPGSFTVNALVKRTLPGSFTLQSILKVTDLNTFLADAVVRRPGQPGSFTLQAVIRKPGVAGSFLVDALVKRTQASSFKVDAWVKGVGGTGAFAVNAVIRKPANPGSYTLDAVIKRTQAGTGFKLDAWLKINRTGSFTVQAIQKVTDLNTLTVDAVVLRRGQASSFTLQAVVKVTDLNTFAVDALVKRTQPGSLTLDAWVVLVGMAVWTTPANFATIADLTPTFTFRMPVGSGEFHFQMQLDTVSTFDSGALLTFDSFVNQTGWEYWNGSTWLPVPSTGVPDGFDGNEARYTLQSPVTAGTWFRRVRAGVI